MWRSSKQEIRKVYHGLRRCQTSSHSKESIENHEPWSTLGILGIFGASLYVIDKHLFNITTCVGPSMLPTFRSDGDVVIVRKISQNSYEVGDVVICESISNPNKTVCKRLAALPGDVIPLETQFGLFKYQIPIDHVWILGDNPPNSHDSRHYGPVPISHLKGRVVSKVRLLEFPSFVQEVRRVKPVFKDYP